MEKLPLIYSSIITLLGLAALAGSLKAISWLLELKFVSRDEMNDNIKQVYKTIDQNKEEMTNKLDKQHQEVLARIDAQNSIFQSLATELANISAKTEIILKHLGLK